MEMPLYALNLDIMTFYVNFMWLSYVKSVNSDILILKTWPLETSFPKRKKEKKNDTWYLFFLMRSWDIKRLVDYG